MNTVAKVRSRPRRTERRLNGAEDSVAQALCDVGELHERARQGVRHAICALSSHYDDLKDYPESAKFYLATVASGAPMEGKASFRAC